MKVGSLCSGYGGLDMAVEAFWPEAEIIWFAENDKDCSRVLAHHWPGVPNLGDLTKVDWHQVDPVDIMCAGFPCQPFSHAGQQRGSDDARAIFTYIADGISVLRPSVVVLENVAAIAGFAHGRGGGLDVVGSLTGLGYGCRWGVVRASDAGAPHRRARWFCVATYPDGPGRGKQRGAVPVGTQQRPAERGRSQTQWGQFTPTIERWERTLGRPAPAPTDDGKLSSSFVEFLMGLPNNHITGIGLSRVAELKALGNGVVPAQGYLALELLHDT